ncbi:hypothetical protein B9479_007237 [Cryptococcus floricola]|uniref:Importin N-terminal domain-containing protein n=1 Tax=Cryptococcus floricola TaxID=2591691 RepID=A0A5D3AKY6_9TREE|nr:hypothetical protein B9479_007237 [Cryptococcus floricola]
MSSAPVLTALHTLYHDPDTAHKKSANEWLQEFQHSSDAWQTCHQLLTSPESPLEGRLFSAQTLRAKITYDLAQLPREQLPPLRDSLISILSPLSQPGAPSGSKAVLLQLCLALSDMALQMPEWDNVVGSMIDRFGGDAATVTVLLMFLKTLPEETTNPRIPLGHDEARTILSRLVSGSAGKVLEVLAMYIDAEGVTVPIQTAVFEALGSWLQAGEVTAGQVASTSLFSAAFKSLASDQLFDPAVDLICDFIHETQEVQENMAEVYQVLPRVIALRPEIEKYKEDPDRVRGYCRILCEAGECYTNLIVQHPADLLPLVQGIAECAAYPDLEIVPITFFFWYSLAEALERQGREFRQNPALAPILDIFASLQTIIIGHLHFPADDEEQTAQEKDEFRTFRHRMGDTLKDCCSVLGAPTCLKKSYDLIVSAMSQPSPSWQEIEAPLFSMRSMGASVDPNDDEVLPHIMALLPKLPEHPKIRYAAILVISRYSQWLNRHPDNLAFQLGYVSAGFELADEQVSAAAAHAMKFICQDCTGHLVPFLGQLHGFVVGVGDRLDQGDMLDVCEAIGYVIEGMPADGGAQALQQFCEPLIQFIQPFASSDTPASEQELEKVADALEQMDAYLSVVKTLKPVPESCYPTCAAVYGVLDGLLARYSKVYHISEKVGSLLRRGLAFFPLRALEPVVPLLLERLATCFNETGYASYLWITGKVADKFGEAAAAAAGAGGPGGGQLAGLLVGSFESVTRGLGELLQRKVAVEIPDVMDDYVHLLYAYLSRLPTLIIPNPALPLAFSHTLQALTCPSTIITLVSLDVLTLLTNLLSPSPSPSPPSSLSSSFPSSSYREPAVIAVTAPVLEPLFAQYGRVLVGMVVKGLVGDFPEDAVEQVEEILVGLGLGLGLPGAGAGAGGMGAGGVVVGWIGEGVGEVGGHLVTAVDKQAFVAQISVD